MLFRHLSGLESILCYDDGVDVAELTRHTEQCLRDLELVKATGLSWFRYPWRWHAIERRPGRYDWGRTDEAMSHLRNLGIEPIIDPCHHVSIPSYLERGFLDPDFAKHYSRFVAAALERYDWVRDITTFNEPYPTTLFAGQTGFWYPYRKSSQAFVAMLSNVARAICEVSRIACSVRGMRSVHFESCEDHQPLYWQDREWADRQNEMRFLVTDLVLGRVNQDHPLYGFLRHNGMRVKDLHWFASQPARIDILALDYYIHSEMQWRKTAAGMKVVRPSSNPRGFASVAMDYVERYGRPIMLGETNIRGSVRDRIGWLKYTYLESERLAARSDVDFRGYGWFPLWDSCAWARDLCRTAKTETDPVGIYRLDQSRRKRLASELSQVFSKLVAGKLSASEIPDVQFDHPVSEWMKGYVPLMEGRPSLTV
jgi:beta-glucosidase/6-phospho-beta-glucosidase/beta-galactosidase